LWLHFVQQLPRPDARADHRGYTRQITLVSTAILHGLVVVAVDDDDSSLARSAFNMKDVSFIVFL